MFRTLPRRRALCRGFFPDTESWPAAAPGCRHGLRRRDDPPATYFASSLRQVRHRHPHRSQQAAGWDHGLPHRSRSDDHRREQPRSDAHRNYRAQVASEVMHLAKNERDQAEATRPPAVDEPSTPTKRDRCVGLYEPTFARFQAGFEAKIAPFGWLAATCLSTKETKRREAINTCLPVGVSQRI